MSKIDDQIKSLQLKKKKVEFLTHILISAKDYSHKDFAEVKDAVVETLEAFVTNAISSIEEGGEPQDTPNPMLGFSESQVKVLQQLADRALNRKPEPPKAPDSTQAPPQNEAPADKMAFALANRHLAGQMVSVANDKNMIVKGKVVGLDAPNVLVKTETGPTIAVPISNISLVS